MIRYLAQQLLTTWRPTVQRAGIDLTPPLHLVQIGGRPGAGRKINFLVFCRRASAPALALKIVRDPALNCELQAEYNVLQTVWQRQELRTTLPRPVGLFDSGHHHVLVEGALPGTPLNVLLRRRRRPLTQSGRLRLLRRYLDPSLCWLRRFQTTSPSSATSFAGRTALDSAMTQLTGTLPELFVTFLQRQADRYRGLSLPLVNAHGDFWAGNLLWRDDHALPSVHDWEAFHPARPPFHDLFLLLTTLAHTYPWGSGNRGDRFISGLVADSARSRLLWEMAGAHCAHFGFQAEALRFFYVFFLLQMAAPGEAADPKRRAQAGAWRTLLQRYAGAWEGPS